MFLHDRSIYKLRDWVKLHDLPQDVYDRCFIMYIWMLNPNLLTEKEVLSVVFDTANIRAGFQDEHLYYGNSLFWSQNKKTLSVDNCVYMDTLSRYGSLELLKENMNQLSFLLVLTNPNAIGLVEEKLNEINWKMDNIHWTFLCSNPAAIPLLEKKPKKIHWPVFSANPGAIDILEKNLDKVCWDMLCTNSNPRAISLLEKNLDKINWLILSSNPAAVPLLEKHTDKIHWCILSTNSNAISILEKNIEKIHWVSLKSNTNLFTYDYAKMKENMYSSHLAEEIVKKALHPTRLKKICTQYNLHLETLFEIYY